MGLPAAVHSLDYINLKLVALGEPSCASTADASALAMAGPLLRNYRQKDLLLGDLLCPADARIQSFLDAYLAEVRPHGAARLPNRTFVLDRPGLARVISLPPTDDRFTSPNLQSYRTAQGVLHNPSSDRRTTQGLFQIVEGGLPVPSDKAEVPKETFARLLDLAMRPPRELLRLPFTAGQQKEAHLFVSLLLRPVIMPAMNNGPERTMEIRFFAPATLTANLDFVETIFGNGGDPFLPENDAALDSEHWTGHTGCVILAPHLAGLRKSDLGLPHYDDATPRQRADGMCWTDRTEVYNDGRAFKVVCRDAGGVIVTVIADSYFGYCKKEVKAQISFAANLFGMAEEEHAGGAIAFPAYVLGQEFKADRPNSIKKMLFEGGMRLLAGQVERRPQGYAVDKRFPTVLYVPESAEFSVQRGFVTWNHGGKTEKLTLVPEHVYVLPSGYRVRLEKQTGGSAWRLVGSVAHGTMCHKPCTVSGGGKSEISKPISNVLLNGPVFVRDYYQDLDEVERILAKDYTHIHRVAQDTGRAGRPILSPERSLGSVIKLLTASADYTDEYNAWLRSIPQTIRQLVFTVKRYYRPEWGKDWREHFTVDRINGFLGHELKFENQKLVGNYLRVGFDPKGAWRIYKLRPDFHPADKVQMEDDITASVVVPREMLRDFDGKYPNRSVKLVANCERFLFQRPDDAIHPGYDNQAEADLAEPGVFVSNFEPLERGEARAIVEHVVEFDQYTEPMQKRLREFVEGEQPDYVVCSSRARLVDGKPSKNPRYLQRRPDLANPREAYLADVCARLDRGIPANQPLHFPVNAVLAGRRGNPPEPGIGLPPLAVYNPIHYQELPELFMDWVCSLTGKSPSTTGFGSEGALTKGPFNALWPVVDLNNALVAAILTEYGGFTTAAGYVGPNYKVDHDISMLAPEVWCRIQVDERDPQFLIAGGFLEKLNDYEHKGRPILASRLGYRITALFAERFLGRMFETPDTVFTEDMLRPEKQDPDAFAAGVEAIVSAQQRVAQAYFEDGSVEGACPPLRALLEIMAHGQTSDGRKEDDAGLRAEFTRESLMASEWYAERLRTKQRRDIELWRRHVASLERAMAAGVNAEFDLAARLKDARAELVRVSAPEYLRQIEGTIGADPFTSQ